jgi:hypothetical protein
MRTRREVVMGAGSLALALGLMPARLLAGTTEALDVRAVGLGSGLSYAKFAALLGETFHIDARGAGVVPVQLVDVLARKPAKATAVNLEQFSVLFQAPMMPVLGDGLYETEHWLAGQALLFLVGIGDARYRADFCLLR